ncbi:DUF2066 domain-containing protein [Thiohalobacter sp.]|uniref:DUF2066 domain-containing protein n=1 Tax=Thiohalobacter sp. TaxID=2025948 RepID=UPI0026106492|nr:DUF2066 domain-containing protein [Thiohalobacter sp.]
MSTANVARALLIGLLALVPAFAAQAAGEDLFRIEVPVADRGPASRDAALAAALDGVLVRLTGVAEPRTLPGADALLGQPARLVRTFQYREGPEDRLLLEVTFEPVALEQAVRAAGLPLWGRDRPDVLLWLAVEDNGQRRLLASDDEQTVAGRALKAAARRRGLPLVLPLMDLEDRRAIGIADVWGGFVERAVAAARRYGAPAVATARIEQVGGGWRGRWTLVFGGETLSWVSDGPDVEAAIAAGMDGLADRLAARLAIRGGGLETGHLLLEVEGVTGLADYARVLRHLEGLDAVRSLRLRVLRAGVMRLQLEVDGGVAALARSLALGRVLEPVDAAGSRYRLMP